MNASYAILQCLQLNVDHWKASWDITTLATSDVIEHMMMRRRCYSQFQSNKEKKPSRFFGRNYPLVGENTWTFAPCKNHSNYRVENVSSSCWNFLNSMVWLYLIVLFYSSILSFLLSNNFLSSYFPGVITLARRLFLTNWLHLPMLSILLERALLLYWDFSLLQGCYFPQLHALVLLLC